MLVHNPALRNTRLKAMESLFSPHQQLADALLPFAAGDSGDGSHDISHLRRVWKNASAIQAKEGGDSEILLASTLLHDCVPVEKNSPLRSQASRLSAEKATRVLAGIGWPDSRAAQVAHAVESHSFSAGIAPTTLEARILQDADRLDAIGMLGIARCFYVAGRMGTALYQSDDPLALARPLDDSRYALDHFHAKLLKLASNFQTDAGGLLARQRHERMIQFLQHFSEEI